MQNGALEILGNVSIYGFGEKKEAQNDFVIYCFPKKGRHQNLAIKHRTKLPNVGTTLKLLSCISSTNRCMRRHLYLTYWESRAQILQLSFLCIERGNL